MCLYSLESYDSEDFRNKKCQITNAKICPFLCKFQLDCQCFKKTFNHDLFLFIPHFYVKLSAPNILTIEWLLPKKYHYFCDMASWTVISEANKKKCKVSKVK